MVRIELRLGPVRHWAQTQNNGLRLEQAGVALGDKGQVLVNDVYQTNVENIYAIGDVTDRVQLTPVAIEEGMCIANNLFTDNPPKSLDYRNIATGGILPTQYRHCGSNRGRGDRRVWAGFGYLRE